MPEDDYVSFPRPTFRGGRGTILQANRDGQCDERHQKARGANPAKPRDLVQGLDGRKCKGQNSVHKCKDDGTSPMKGHSVECSGKGDHV